MTRFHLHDWYPWHEIGPYSVDHYIDGEYWKTKYYLKMYRRCKKCGTYKFKRVRSL